MTGRPKTATRIERRDARSTSLHRARIAQWLDGLRSSYWFLPGAMVVASAFLAALTVRLDRIGALAPEVFPEWIRLHEPDPARAVLATIAGAMITIVSLTFSISIVALALASSQFGSRLLYNFMRDRKNHVVLGVFLGTFVYCLLALVSVRSGDTAVRPQLAMTGALLLSLVSVAFLIFFIHHVAESIQASNVITGVGRELVAVIERTLPEAEDDEDGNGFVSELPNGVSVFAPRSGTLQAIDGEALVELARREDVELWLARRPGDYLIEGSEIARVQGATELSEEFARAFAGALILGNRRTLVQDVEFAFHQLVEIAARALSPGVNDPFTAMSCIDELGNALGRVAQRGAMIARLSDAEGRVRLHLDVTDFDGIVGAAFDPIRRHAARDLAVMLHLLEAMQRVAPLLRSEAQRNSFRLQGRLAHELAAIEIETDTDREALRARSDALELALEAR